MIEAAVGITLLLIASYVVVGSIITSANTVSDSQKDVTLQNEARLKTDISISNVLWRQYGPLNIWYLRFNITNTGSEIIGNFNATDVFVTNSTDTPKRYTYDAPHFGTYPDIGTWTINSISPDNNHPQMLDPGETMIINVGNLSSVHTNTSVGFITSNGVSAVYAL